MLGNSKKSQNNNEYGPMYKLNNTFDKVNLQKYYKPQDLTFPY